MYEVDFLPVESLEGPGSQSGDAIAVHLVPSASDSEYVVVIDGGYSKVGEELVDHIDQYYKQTYIDLVISTHPDADHLNGLVKVLEQCHVEELWVHQPRLHRTNVADFSNIEALDNLINTAERLGVTITEPFTGTTACDGIVTVLGPTEEYYEQLLDESLARERGEAKGLLGALEHSLKKAASAVGSALDRVLAELPIETLTDSGETDPRNNMSVVTLMQLDNRRLLFTGDAGMPAIEEAADEYELLLGSFAQAPLRFIQVPHHGSRRNVGPTVLNRMLGEVGSPYAGRVTAFVSSAKASSKHPSAMVVNAFSRRGCEVSATEGITIRHHFNGPSRGWSSLTPIPPLDESGEDEHE